MTFLQKLKAKLKVLTSGFKLFKTLKEVIHHSKPLLVKSQITICMNEMRNFYTTSLIDSRPQQN